MIACVWRGAGNYMAGTGVPGYSATPGNHAVYMLRRAVGDRCEFVMLTLWESLAAVKAFAGPDHKVAVFYPEDDRYLIKRDRRASHYQVLGEGPTPRPEWDPSRKGAAAW